MISSGPGSPVVFVGPYERHSNEVTWREGFAAVREVRLSDDGGVDLDHLTEVWAGRNMPRRDIIAQ